MIYTQAEYDRQMIILARQYEGFESAKPSSRFAHAAHMTKTERKARSIWRVLYDRDNPLPYPERMFAHEYVATLGPKEAA